MDDKIDKNKKIEFIIADLIKFTGENKIQWQYTNNNGEVSKMIYKILGQKVPSYDGYFTTDNCFYTKINNGYISVIEWSSSTTPSKYYLAIAPDIGAKVFEVYDTLQVQIARLHSLILRKFPNIDLYLTDVFNTFKNI